MIRRQFVAGASGGVALLAGCSAPDDGAAESVDAAWPTVDAPEIEGWELVDRRSERHPTGLGVTAHERTHVYENAALAEEVAEKTLGRFDGPLASMFAAHIELRGYATALATPERIADELRPEFETAMADHGVESIATVEPGTPVPAVPESAELTEYRGTYPMPAVEQAIDLPDGGDHAFTIDADEMDVTGLVAVWKDGTGTAFAGGGVVPAENFTATDASSVTGDYGEGIDVTVSVDLGLDPDVLREELVALVGGVTVRA